MLACVLRMLIHLYRPPRVASSAADGASDHVDDADHELIDDLQTGGAVADQHRTYSLAGTLRKVEGATSLYHGLTPQQQSALQRATQFNAVRQDLKQRLMHLQLILLTIFHLRRECASLAMSRMRSCSSSFCSQLALILSRLLYSLPLLMFSLCLCLSPVTTLLFESFPCEELPATIFSVI